MLKLPIFLSNLLELWNYQPMRNKNSGTVFHISGRFSTWSIFATVQCRSKLLHFEGNFFTMIFKVTIYYMFQRLNCSLCKCSLCFTHCWVNFNVFLLAKFFKSSTILCSFINPNISGVFFREIIFLKHLKCLRHTLFLLFELWQISKKYLQQLRDTWLCLKTFLLFFDKPLALLKFWKEQYAALPL